MSYIKDEPIDLNEIDMLGSKKYSELLKDCIINSPADRSITIGIYGEWGSGKSSIIKTVMNDLNKTEPKIKFITYDSWKYSNDGFRRTFLLQVQNDLKSQKISKKSLQNKFYSNISYSWLILSSTVFVIIMGMLISLGQSLLSSFTVSFLVLLLTYMLQMIPSITSSAIVQKPYYFSPEQFENDFDIMISEALKKKKVEKIVITIDNMDRCPQEQTY